MTEKSTGGVIGAGFVMIASLAVLAAVLWINHRDDQKRRTEFRSAVTLIARANCKELDIIRSASLARATDQAQRVAVHAFYKQLEAPINDALEKLGQMPCRKDGTP